MLGLQPWMLRSLPELCSSSGGSIHHSVLTTTQQAECLRETPEHRRPAMSCREHRA